MSFFGFFNRKSVDSYESDDDYGNKNSITTNDYDIESASYLNVSSKTNKSTSEKENHSKTFSKPNITITASSSSIQLNNHETPVNSPIGTPVNHKNRIIDEIKRSTSEYLLSRTRQEYNSKDSGEEAGLINDDIKLYNKEMEKINKYKDIQNAEISTDYVIGEILVDEELGYFNGKNINIKKTNQIYNSDNDENNLEKDEISNLSTNSRSSVSDTGIEIEEDHFGNYILKESKSIYNYNSFYCQFLWSGIEHLDHWELQRKVNKEHAKQILIQMKKDYKSTGKFIFYDVIHLGLKSDGKYYVIDGQHRLVAYYNLFFKNIYPVQKVPAVIWDTKTDDEFLEIYERINKRVPFDVTPFHKKILDIIFQMDNTFGNGSSIWGKKRPKIDKNLFIEEMKTNDDVHKLDADTIVKKIIEINIKIRGLPRSKRSDGKITSQIHASAEEMDFYLGYDKSLKWIHEILI